MKKNFLILLILFLSLFTVGCKLRPNSNKVIKSMQSGEKTSLSYNYIYNKGFSKIKYADDDFVSFTSIKVVFRGYKQLAYFDCLVNISITYNILTEDGLYHEVKHRATVRLDPLGDGVLKYTYEDKCRNVKGVAFQYEFKGSVTKK